MPHYRCVRDNGITEVRFPDFQKVECKLCGGTLESSLYIDTNLEDIKAYNKHLDYMTCKKELIWNENFTQILGHRLYTEQGIVEDIF